MERNVWITSSSVVAEVNDLLPANRGRQSLVTSLIKAYGLDKQCAGIIKINKSKRQDLEKFHGANFLDVLLRARPKTDRTLSEYNRIRSLVSARSFIDTPIEDQNINSTAFDAIQFGNELADKYKRQSKREGSLGAEAEIEAQSESESESESEPELESEPESDEEDYAAEEEPDEVLDKFGLRFDCPIFPFMAEYAKIVASSSVSGAKQLIKESETTSGQNVVINWYGGRHHCFKNKAAGFCYVNDITLAINVLRSRYKKIFYLDIDLHHGDGVESAFEFSRAVMTCSIHRYDIGFYPGTGDLKSSTKHKINIPTQKGLDDESMLQIIQEIVLPLMKSFETEAIVLQTGTDGLATDEHRQWNMTIKGYGQVLDLLFKNMSSVPLLILGGGGYNHTETAKCWTYLTYKALKDGNECDNWDFIPDHDHFNAYYEDGFRFWTQENSSPKPRRNENTKEYIESMKDHILSL